MRLLVDMGNTRLKWAMAENQSVLAGEALLNEAINQQTLLNLWQPITPPQCIVIACVTANQRLELITKVALNLWANIEIIQVTAQKQGFGVTNAYAQPEKLGVDRWLALIAARQLYATPVCVVDCGTAITVDLMNADGQHTGGLISAGLALMKQSLARGTNALPFTMTDYELKPANNTEAAIYSGTLWAAVGLIEQVLAKQSSPFTVLLTGGDAQLIAQYLSVGCVVDADLVLRGLAIIAD